MNFDIPMSTKGTMSLTDLASGGLPASNTPQGQMNNMQTQNFAPQQEWGQSAQPNFNSQNQSFNQSQQNYNQPMQQPIQQPNFDNPGGFQQPIQPQQNQFNQQQPQAQNFQQKARPAAGGVILKKGQKTNLQSASGQALSKITVGLGWDLVNQACDLDASAFILGQDGRVLGDDWFVFYGQITSPDGSIIHSGDSTGEGAGDDETITINLNQVNPQVKKIVFVVTIDEALQKGQNFSMVANAYVRVVDNNTGGELMRFNLTDYYSNVTSMMVGEVYNHNGQWKFNAIGDGVAKDLAGLCEMYGVNVAG